jgi:hypothetical protein
MDSSRLRSIFKTSGTLMLSVLIFVLCMVMLQARVVCSRFGKPDAGMQFSACRLKMGMPSDMEKRMKLMP